MVLQITKGVQMRKKRFEALLLSLVLALSPLSTMQVQAKNVSDDTKVKTVQNTGYIESDLDKNVPVRRAGVATYAMLPSAYSTDIVACDANIRQCVTRIHMVPAGHFLPSVWQSLSDQ